jgi:hypothetical protein
VFGSGIAWKMPRDTHRLITHAIAVRSRPMRRPRILLAARDIPGTSSTNVSGTPKVYSRKSFIPSPFDRSHAGLGELS